MIKQISSRFTFFYKYIFTIIWIGGFGAGTLSLFMTGDDAKWMYLIGWLFGLTFLWGTCVRLKRVEIKNDHLIISNYFKTIEISLREIDYIREYTFMNIHPVWLVLRSASEFGNVIMFMPKGIALFRSHPVVQELKLIAGLEDSRVRIT